MSDPVVPIGEFSRLTYLSVKTLRHYHEVGLLVPTEVDPSSGYRRYSLDQVPRAQLIRRLRELEMSVADVRTLLAAPDDAGRAATTINAHLARMEAELARHRAVVASLRALLTPAPAPDVRFVTVAPQAVFAVRGVVAATDAEQWYSQARRRIEAALDRARVRATGPHGATWPHEYFEDERGEVIAFAPVPAGATPARGSDDVESAELDGGRFAVAEHVGGFDDSDRTYGALGSHVIRNAVPLPEPIREVYRVIGPGEQRTDVYWPVRPAPASA